MQVWNELRGFRSNASNIILLKYLAGFISTFAKVAITDVENQKPAHAPGKPWWKSTMMVACRVFPVSGSPSPQPHWLYFHCLTTECMFFSHCIGEKCCRLSQPAPLPHSIAYLPLNQNQKQHTVLDSNNPGHVKLQSSSSHA